jgi:hypothetical protein
MMKALVIAKINEQKTPNVKAWQVSLCLRRHRLKRSRALLAYARTPE